MATGNQKAPDGHLWVCTACGKTATWSYGFDDKGKRASLAGWDSSCACHAHLVAEADVVERSPGGRVLRVRDGAQVTHWSDL